MAGRDSKGMFAKGNPGGPGRPPRGKGLSDIVRAVLGEEAEGRKGMTKLDVVIEELVRRAMSGDLYAVAMMFNRGWGKDMEIIKIDHDGELDLSDLSDEELAIWQSLLKKVTDVDSD